MSVSSSFSSIAEGTIALTRPWPKPAAFLFTEQLQALLASLGCDYRERVDRLLEDRRSRQEAFNRGEVPGFDPATQEIRQSEWTVAEIPADLRDRRVEITGPVDRKMIINALNSGARVFMADFEDSSTPTWENMVLGQANLYDAVRRTIELTTAQGKHYRLNENPAVLIARPRGWHLDEKHLLVGGRPIPAAIFDATVYVASNAQELIARGSGPYLYLPKLEHYREAALWQEVLTRIEQAIGLADNTIKVTVLIETLPAVFQMDEILHALRHRIVGLNCGRWDYIFSYIKCFQKHPDKVLPDRSQVTMEVPFLRAYSQLLIRTCHRRGAFAMGGMAAQIPIRNDEQANRRALERVGEDKEREARAGHDGTWVAHPGLIALAMEIFDRHLEGPNQLGRLLSDIEIKSEELIEPCAGTITEDGVVGNLEVAIRYLAAWLAGQGCVPIAHLMEDAATAEIARAQLWQWLHHPAGTLDNGRPIDRPLIESLLERVTQSIKAEIGAETFVQGHFAAASELVAKVTFSDRFVEFITLPAYARLD